MTEDHHLSADLVADLLDGGVPAAEAMAANSHLATCAACRQLRDDQAFVTALLAEEARVMVEMPTDVALALETAIHRAADERANGVVSLERARHRSARRPVRWLAGAAAAVAVAGVGVAGWQLVDRGATDTSASNHAGRTTHSGSLSTDIPTTDEVSGPTLPNGTVKLVRPVTPAELPHRARYFAAHPQSGLAPSAEGCARPSGSGPSMVVRWRGKPAILLLDTATRTAKILDCATARAKLYATGY